MLVKVLHELYLLSLYPVGQNIPDIPASLGIPSYSSICRKKSARLLASQDEAGVIEYGKSYQYVEVLVCVE